MPAIFVFVFVCQLNACCVLTRPVHSVCTYAMWLHRKFDFKSEHYPKFHARHNELKGGVAKGTPGTVHHSRGTLPTQVLVKSCSKCAEHTQAHLGTSPTLTSPSTKVADEGMVLTAPENSKAQGAACFYIVDPASTSRHQVRSGPGTTFVVVGTLSGGARVQAVEKHGDWLRLADDSGKNVWMMERQGKSTYLVPESGENCVFPPATPSSQHPVAGPPPTPLPVQVQAADETTGLGAHASKSSSAEDTTPSASGSRPISRVLSESEMDRLQLDADKATIDKDSRLGSGSFADVYEGEYTFRKGITSVAFKVFRDVHTIDQVRADANVLRELEIGHRVRHKNLVKIYGIVEVSSSVCLVMERMANESLGDRLKATKDKGVHIAWEDRISYACDVVCGMRHLHGLEPTPIVHRDLKSSNVLLSIVRGTGRQTAKVADFGLSKEFVSAGNTYGGVGTLAWSGPETFSGKFSEESDVYSFGMVLYELGSRRQPFHDVSRQETLARITNVFKYDPVDLKEEGWDEAKQQARWLRKFPLESRRPNLEHLEDDCPDSIREAIQQCWVDAPKERPDFATLTPRFETNPTQRPAPLFDVLCFLYKSSGAVDLRDLSKSQMKEQKAFGPIQNLDPAIQHTDVRPVDTFEEVSKIMKMQQERVGKQAGDQAQRPAGALRILHFSGHGNNTLSFEDVDPEPAAFAKMIRKCEPDCVIFNACNTRVLARHVAQGTTAFGGTSAGPVVVFWDSEVQTENGCETFSKHFYEYLARSAGAAMTRTGRLTQAYEAAKEYLEVKGATSVSGTDNQLRCIPFDDNDAADPAGRPTRVTLSFSRWSDPCHADKGDAVGIIIWQVDGEDAWKLDARHKEDACGTGYIYIKSRVSAAGRTYASLCESLLGPAAGDLDIVATTFAICGGQPVYSTAFIHNALGFSWKAAADAGSDWAPADKIFVDRAVAKWCEASGRIPQDAVRGGGEGEALVPVALHIPAGQAGFFVGLPWDTYAQMGSNYQGASADGASRSRGTAAPMAIECNADGQQTNTGKRRSQVGPVSVPHCQLAGRDLHLYIRDQFVRWFKSRQAAEKFGPNVGEGFEDQVTHGRVGLVGRPWYGPNNSRNPSLGSKLNHLPDWFVFFFGDAEHNNAEAVLGPEQLNKKTKTLGYKWRPCLHETQYAHNLFTKLSKGQRYSWWLVSFLPNEPGVPSTSWEQLKLVARTEAFDGYMPAAPASPYGGHDTSSAFGQVPPSPGQYDATPVLDAGSIAVAEGYPADFTFS